ncbi:PRC-barrel domain-containing protein [Microvirga lenta]|uniref:PRC-barrel domain-containing protein n=1 Tax=Microvirga lenta TaxID=2881337 RepID=UPI001CFFE1EF|nr:PRC-barrel domain-containing protein [Microvirga lenta]MCB5177453.1 PRC-barrel domain-containing protein [Microvirga lenta]
MKRKALTGLLLAAIPAGAFASQSSPQSNTASAECDRLIQVLEQRSPTAAHEALQQMRIYRDGNQYQACLDTARTAQSGAASLSDVQVERIAGIDVYNDKGMHLGDVDRVVVGNDQQTYVLVTYRGPRWPGNKQVALPLNDMTLRDGRLQISGIGEDELRLMPAAQDDGRRYTTLQDTGTVSVRRPADTPSETGSTR